jgi:hypothetical protein
LVLLAAILSARGAEAQSITNCNQVGSGVSCSTMADPMAQMRQQQQDMQQQQRDLQAFMASPAPRGPMAMYSWRDVPPTKCTRMDLLTSSNPSFCPAREVGANRKVVGDLVAQGKCDEALKGALGTGDLQFARDVRDFCSGH